MASSDAVATVRRYRPGEEEALWSLLHQTVHSVNRRHYTPEQLEAWAPREHDSRRWRERLAETNPFAATVGDRLVGFAELRGNGLIDWTGIGSGAASGLCCCRPLSARQNDPASPACSPKRALQRATFS